MPFDVVADFKEREGASKIDALWSGIARSMIMKLVEREPRVRIRIRNFPPPAVLETGDKSTIAKSGIALSESDVPQLLRDRINISEGEEYWIHNYRCMTCLDADGNGTWVPHIRRKLHHDHDLKDLGITGKGIRQPWTTTHRLVIGDSKRIAGMSGLLYSVALTGPVKDIQNIKGFDAVVILPIKKGFTDEDYVSQVLLMKLLGTIEKNWHLSSNTELAVGQLLSHLQEIDPKFLAPVENTENIEEDAEYKQQVTRDKIARRVMAGMGHGKAIREVLKGQEPEEKP